MSAYLKIIFTCVVLVKAGLVVGSLCLSVCQSVHRDVRPSIRNTFWVPSLYNL